jgi:hypothetical protein
MATNQTSQSNPWLLLRSWFSRDRPNKIVRTPTDPVAEHDISDDQIWQRIVKVIEQQRKDADEVKI